MAEHSSCPCEEDVNHVKELLEQSNRNARLLWDWLALSDQRSFIYEHPELVTWLKDTLAHDRRGKSPAPSLA